MKRGLALAALPLGAAAFLTRELYRYVFCREGSPLLAPILDSKGHEPDYYTWRENCAEALRQRPQRRFTIRSARGERLAGFYYPAGGEGKRIAFIVHGYRSEHADTAGMFFDYYASRGYDLFCCDHTAHGESGGRQVGFDFFETEDCLLWLEELRRRFGPEIRVVLHGFSMGAATVLKMAGRCPPWVRGIVADCGYKDGRAQLKSMLGPAYWPMRILNRLAAGYDLSETDVEQSLAASTLPILFFHGEEDRLVPFANGPALYALYRGEKDALFVPGAKHMECLWVDPAGYTAKLDAFLGRWMD